MIIPRIWECMCFNIFCLVDVHFLPEFMVQKVFSKKASLHLSNLFFKDCYLAVTLWTSVNFKNIGIIVHYCMLYFGILLHRHGPKVYLSMMCSCIQSSYVPTVKPKPIKNLLLGPPTHPILAGFAGQDHLICSILAASPPKYCIKYTFLPPKAGGKLAV